MSDEITFVHSKVLSPKQTADCFNPESLTRDPSRIGHPRCTDRLMSDRLGAGEECLKRSNSGN